MNPRSKWLLQHLAKVYPLGVACTMPLPTPDNLGKVGMAHINILLKKGLAHEPSRGIYFVTEAGLLAAKEI